MNAAQSADHNPDDQPSAEPATVVAARPAAGTERAAGTTPTAGTAPTAGGESAVSGPDGERSGGEQVVPSAIRAQRSTKDMVISLLVLLVPIALVIGFGRVFLGADQPTVVDPAPAVQQARAADAFPVSEPTSLSDGWRVVRAEFRRADSGSTLRIGYLSPDGAGVQLVQSNLPADELLPAELTRDGQPQGAIELGGRAWQRYTARPGELALVLLESGRTVLVVGQVSEGDLRQVVESLR